jgi:protease-4
VLIMQSSKQELFLKLLWIFYLSATLIALFSLLPKSLFHLGRGKKGALAIVHIYGLIHTRETSTGWGGPDTDEIVRRLHKISEDDDIKAVLLRINSPGGSVGAVQEIYTEIIRCKTKGKKVIASMGDVAASGGYYLASAADRIVADPGSITGSIGVILEFGNLEGLFEKLGVKLQVIKSGAHKDIGSPARPLTIEERQMLQASINDAYNQFTDAVSQGRRMPIEKVKALADGRIFTGRQALAAGLVDQLGNSRDAIKLAIDMADLPENPQIYTDETHSLLSMMQLISSRWANLIPWLHESETGISLEYRLQ